MLNVLYSSFEGFMGLKFPVGVVAPAIGLIVLTGGAAIPVIVFVGILIVALNIFDAMVKPTSSSSTVQDRDTPTTANSVRRSTHRDNTSVSNHYDHTDESEENYDYDNDLYERHIDRYGIAPQHFDEEHPLADSYDPDKGISFKDYCDMQGY